MNLICPHCQKTVAIADNLAGQTTRCPQCAGPFTVPMMPTPLAPTIEARPPAPPPSTPPANPPSSHTPDPFSQTVVARAALPEKSIHDTDPSGVLATDFRPRWSVPLHPMAVQYTALACFALLFILLWFQWIASPLDGKYAFSQSGFGSAFGSFAPAPTDGSASMRAAAFIILYFLVILVGLLAAIGLVAATVVLPRANQPVPAVMVQLLPHRSLLVGGIALFAFFFLSLQLLLGFPATSHNFGADSPVLNALLYKTFWLKLSFLLSLIALIAALADFWLERRGKKPWPKLTLDW